MKGNILTILVLGAVSAAVAEPSWVALYSESYSGNSGAAKADCYSAYYLTQAEAKDLFGNATTAAGISSYLMANFNEASEDLSDYPKPTQPVETAGGVQNLGDALWLTYGEYQFELGLLDPASALAFAVLLFDNQDGTQAFRVYDSNALDDLALANGNLAYMGDLESVGWKTVPEPTGALLMLLGLAGLALKRKNV